MFCAIFILLALPNSLAFVICGAYLSAFTLRQTVFRLHTLTTAFEFLAHCSCCSLGLAVAVSCALVQTLDWVCVQTNPFFLSNHTLATLPRFTIFIRAATWRFLTLVLGGAHLGVRTFGQALLRADANLSSAAFFANGFPWVLFSTLLACLALIGSN